MITSQHKDFSGLNGFIWWIGVIEDRKDPLKLGRCRVRIAGWHTENKSLLPTRNLLWAQVMLPVNNTNTYTPKESDMVVGFFADGENGQMPVIMGVLPGIPLQAADPQQGFNDPRTGDELTSAPVKPNESATGYPRKLDEPTTSRLARNESIDDSIVSRKKTKKLSKVEPEPYYAAQYPYNNAIETESGHAFELDDTPNAERVHIYHRSGSYVEWAANGDRAERIEKDKFTVVVGDDKVYIQGSVNIEIDGSVNMIVGGTVTALADSFNLTGDLNVTGDITASGVVTDSGAVLATHTHSGVVTGGNNTGPPN